MVNPIRAQCFKSVRSVTTTTPTRWINKRLTFMSGTTGFGSG
jgi:hypothetical protein